MITRPLSRVGLACLAFVAASIAGCSAPWNDPYPVAERRLNLIHEFISERPKHLDPVQSYTEPEAWVNFQIYEPLYDYDYLVRPYRLRPNLAAAMPRISYLGKNGEPLGRGAADADVAYSVYEIPLRTDIRYQPHPAFAKDAQGKGLYFDLPAEVIRTKRSVADFPQTGTRDVLASDFAYELKRIARPKLHSPALEIFKTIDGMSELVAQLASDAAAGKIDPDGFIDLTRYTLRGVDTPDPHTLRIRLRGKYPQFIYWLAMTFAAPVPPEVDRFYSQPGMLANNLSLDTWPVGTGPYLMAKHEENREILMLKNPNWRGETYPCEGEANDKARGFLHDCGKAMPLNDGIKWVLEKEGIPFWNKFLQGFYDEFNSIKIRLASLDLAVNAGAGGGFDPSPEMRERGVQVTSEVEPGVWYFGFNMLDPVWGAQNKDAVSRERARKLRLAVSIALDSEEFVQIFYAGLGLPAYGPIPPGLQGYQSGERGINPYIYDWVEGHAQRKSLEEARRLLAEAGYPDGRDRKTGEPLVLYYDGVDRSDKREQLQWIQGKLGAIGVQMVARISDYNRWQEKQLQGNANLIRWGWSADFPDPENFFFLFYSKNAKIPYQGENTSNFSSAEFDRLYETFRLMEIDDPKREPLITRMVELLRHDAPWAFLYHDVTVNLANPWVHNSKPGRIIRATRKYQRIDGVDRNQRVAQWNRPVLWPLAVIALCLVALLLVLVGYYRRHEQARAITQGDA